MLEPNTILQDRYRVIRQLGRGGMGTIFEAIDERVNRSVVLKKASFDSEERRADFKREAQLLANLRHPALPKVSDHFEERGGQYLVMDFIPGNDLAELLRLLGRPFPLTDVLRWADELLKVLEYLHSYSPPILHRDIKPANLKLSRDGEIFLLDFGLAKGAAGQMPTIVPNAKSIPGYTPNYAPLEQILRADKQFAEYISIDALSIRNAEEVERILQSETTVRSDLYALGTTLYHLITNEVPCNAVRRAMYVWNGQQDPMRPAHEVNSLIPVEISNVLASATSIFVDQRPPNAAAMRAALRDASLSLKMPAGEIALSQLSQQAIDSIVELTLERLLKQVEGKVTRSEADIERLTSEMCVLGKQVSMVAQKVEELTKQKRLESMAEIDPAVVDSLTRSAVERLSATELPRIVTSIVKSELAQQETVKAVPQPAINVPAVPSPRTQSSNDPLPVPVKDQEEERFHRDARRFARLLVAEMKLYNEQKLAEGRRSRDIYQRLREYIDRSREMYNKRTKPVVSRKWDYFHEELIRTLAEGDPAGMGKGYPGEMLERTTASGA
jgi:serine/threonine protein kinase